MTPGVAARGYMAGLIATFGAAFLCGLFAVATHALWARVFLILLTSGLLFCGVFGLRDLVAGGLAVSSMDQTLMRRRAAFWLLAAGVVESAMLSVIAALILAQPFPGPKVQHFTGTAWKVETSRRSLSIWAEGRNPSLVRLRCSRGCWPWRYDAVWKQVPPLQSEVPIDLITSGETIVLAKVNGVVMVDPQIERRQDRRMKIGLLAAGLIGIGVCALASLRLARLIWRF